MTKSKGKQRKMKTISLTEIQIPTVYTNMPPRPEKLKAKKAYIHEHGKPERSLIVHPVTQELVDGWASYLALKELGCTTVEVELGTKKHPQPDRNRNFEALTEATKLAVWEAEDGRCEMCSRPMDKRMARFRRVNPKTPFHADNLHLVCIDCKKGQSDLLDQITVPPSLIQKIAAQTGMGKETISPMLITLLKKHGVLVNIWNEKRQYWLPGIGKFKINTKACEVIHFEFYSQPTLKMKEQERTRGLPKPV